MIFEVQHLSKSFGGVAAVQDVSIRCAPGTITGIIGPNGSGKSTLVNLVSGMIPFERGVILVNRSSISILPRHRARAHGITRTFQEVRVFEHMTVEENLMLMIGERDLFHAMLEGAVPQKHARVYEALHRVGLSDKRGEYARSLSYGQRKLLEVARVMLVDVDVIFFDEPFAGLFREMVETVQGVLKELRAQSKIIILIEHNMELIRALSDYLIVMDSGSVLSHGIPAEVLNDPRVIEAYIGK